jgi:tetratricopeptide (TPR) repeat protein
MKKYVFLAPDLANPHDSLGEVLTFIGRYDEAEKEFVASLQIQPDFFYSLLNLARVHIERGQLRKGVEILERTREQFEGHAVEKWIDLTLIEMYYDHQMFDQLRPATLRYFTEYPDDRQSGRIRAYYLAYSGRIQEGRAVADSLLEFLQSEPLYGQSERYIREIDSMARTFDAIVHEIRDEHIEAVLDWREALALLEHRAPHHLGATRLRYGESLARVGHHKGALKQAELILATNPNLIRPLLLQAGSSLVLRQEERVAQALRRLQDILSRADADHPAVARADSLRGVLAELDRVQ